MKYAFLFALTFLLSLAAHASQEWSPKLRMVVFVTDEGEYTSDNKVVFCKEFDPAKDFAFDKTFGVDSFFKIVTVPVKDGDLALNLRIARDAKMDQAVGVEWSSFFSEAKKGGAYNHAFGYMFVRADGELGEYPQAHIGAKVSKPGFGNGPDAEGYVWNAYFGWKKGCADVKR